MERAALVIDLENIVHAERRADDWSGAVGVITDLVQGLSARMTLVTRVAVCDPSLARRLAFPLQRLGIRTFVHSGGPNAADCRLERHLCDEIPSSCSVVVVASGDHHFTRAASMLQGRGIEIEVLARPGTVAASLYRQADRFTHMDARPAWVDRRNG